ncbi:MAG: GFA family protein [Advenella sp.]|uniref:CENP-V/GFA domain-containing protein n=1 Tax=Advenella kashmirensis TaxID=310575 RepID=A0A356LLC9_9BURK|nr:hypothetical protein [Advenella kashmirensis]
MSVIDKSFLCGACSNQSEAPPLNIRTCHCRRCQKATGSAFYSRVMVLLDSYDQIKLTHSL